MKTFKDLRNRRSLQEDNTLPRIWLDSNHTKLKLGGRWYFEFGCHNDDSTAFQELSALLEAAYQQERISSLHSIDHGSGFSIEAVIPGFHSFSTSEAEKRILGLLQKINPNVKIQSANLQSYLDNVDPLSEDTSWSAVIWDNEDVAWQQSGFLSDGEAQAYAKEILRKEFDNDPVLEIEVLKEGKNPIIDAETRGYEIINCEKQVVDANYGLGSKSEAEKAAKIGLKNYINAERMAPSGTSSGLPAKAKVFKESNHMNIGEIIENALAGQTLPGPMNPDGAIDTPETSIFYLEKDGELARLNSYVGQIGKRAYPNPDFPINLLQSKLSSVGLWFKYRNEFDPVKPSQCICLPLIRFGGSYGWDWQAGGGEVQSTNGFKDGCSYNICFTIDRTDNSDYIVKAEVIRDACMGAPNPYDSVGTNLQSLRRRRQVVESETPDTDQEILTEEVKIVNTKKEGDKPYIIGFKGNSVGVYAPSLWDAKEFAMSYFKPSKKDSGLVWAKLAVEEAIDYTKQGRWFRCQRIKVKPGFRGAVGDIAYLRKGGWETPRLYPNGQEIPGGGLQGRIQIWKPPYYASTIGADEAKECWKVLSVVPADQQDKMSSDYDWELHR